MTDNVKLSFHVLLGPFFLFVIELFCSDLSSMVLALGCCDQIPEIVKEILLWLMSLLHDLWFHCSGH